MNLIIERNNGTVYSYFESRKQFKNNQEKRKNLRRLDAKDLDHECDLSLHGDNFYMVVPVKKKKLEKSWPAVV